MDHVMADKCLPILIAGDKDEFNRSFRRGEGWVGLVGLLVGGDKAHVSRRDTYEGRHVVVAADCGRDPRDVLPHGEYQDH